MAASTATTIKNPNFVIGAPRAKAVYNQVGSLGVTIENPGGQQLTIAGSRLAGLGTILLDQGGQSSAYSGYPSRLPIAGMQLQGVFTNISANTTLTAPDVGGLGAQGLSFLRLAPSSDIDWIGGIATPVQTGAASVLGTQLLVTNISSSGSVINVFDRTVGGSIWCPYPQIAIGYEGWALFIFDAFGWHMVSFCGGYQFDGPFNQQSRVTTTTDATPKYLLRWPKGAAATNGLLWHGDVSFYEAATGATYSWFGNSFAYDAANDNYLALADIQHGGNAAGIALVGGGVGLSLADDGTYHQLIITGANAHTLKWAANNGEVSIPPS